MANNQFMSVDPAQSLQSDVPLMSVDPTAKAREFTRGSGPNIDVGTAITRQIEDIDKESTELEPQIDESAGFGGMNIAPKEEFMSKDPSIQQSTQQTIVEDPSTGAIAGQETTSVGFDPMAQGPLQTKAFPGAKSIEELQQDEGFVSDVRGEFKEKRDVAKQEARTKLIEKEDIATQAFGTRDKKGRENASERDKLSFTVWDKKKQLGEQLRQEHNIGPEIPTEEIMQDFKQQNPEAYNKYVGDDEVKHQAMLDDDPFYRIGRAGAERMENIKNIINEDQTIAETILQVAGQGGAAIGDVIWEGITEAYDLSASDKQEENNKILFKEILNTDTGQFAVSKLAQGMEAYENWKGESNTNNRLGKNIEGILNLAEFIPIIKGAKVGTKGVKNMIKRADDITEQALKNVEPIVEDIARQTAKDIKKGAQKVGDIKEKLSPGINLDDQAIKQAQKNPFTTEYLNDIHKATDGDMSAVAREYKDEAVKKVGDDLIKPELDARLETYKEGGQMYQKLRDENRFIDITDLDKEAKVIADKYPASALTPKDRTNIKNALEQVDLIMEDARAGRFDTNAGLDSRQTFDKMIDWDGASTKGRDAIKEIRGSLDKRLKAQIPGLEETDKIASKKIKELKEFKKQLITKEGNINYTNLRNVNNLSKTELANRLDEFVPGATDRIDAINQAIRLAKQTQGLSFGGKLATKGAAITIGALTGGPRGAALGFALEPLLENRLLKQMTKSKVNKLLKEFEKVVPDAQSKLDDIGKKIKANKKLSDADNELIEKARDKFSNKNTSLKLLELPDNTNGLRTPTSSNTPNSSNVEIGEKQTKGLEGFGDLKKKLKKESTKEDVVKFVDENIEDVKKQYKNTDKNYINDTLILNTDDVRPFVGEGVGIPAKNTHEGSSLITKSLRNDLIENSPKGSKVMVLGGGGGSGKGYTLDNVIDPKGYAWIEDKTLSKPKNIAEIKDLMNKGFDVDVNYVYSPQDKAWVSTINRYVRKQRNGGAGRTVPLTPFQEAHIGTLKNMAKLYDEGIPFKVYYSEGKGVPFEISYDDLKRTVSKNKNITKTEAIKILDDFEKDGSKLSTQDKLKFFSMLILAGGGASMAVGQ